MASPQGIRRKFPTQRNRELFRQNREFWRKNREFTCQNRNHRGMMFSVHTALPVWDSKTSTAFKTGRVGRWSLSIRRVKRFLRLALILTLDRWI